MTRLILFCAVLGLWVATPAPALDILHQQIADTAVERGIDYLRSTQNPDGSWTPTPGPAVTGLVLTVMLDQPDIDAEDPTVARGLRYILDRVQDDGSIRDGADGILANYNTAICVSALARLHGHPEAAAAVAGAQRFLKSLQWQEGMTTPDGQTITPEHPFYGGAGYGRPGRPDMSNTHFLLQGLYDSGVNCEDPAFVRAVAFISRCQGIESNDYFPEGTIVEDGAFLYATSINRELVGVPESKANPQQMDEAKLGRPVSGLRGYGSITYAGFKSLLYADLSRDDPRVVAALDWIQDNYALDRNPGMPEQQKLQGLYYYYMTMGRALSAWGGTYLEVGTDEKTATVRAHRGVPMAAVLAEVERLKAEGYEQVNLATLGSAPGEPSGEQSADEAMPGGSPIAVIREPGIERINWANRLIAHLASVQRPDGSYVNDEDRWMEGDANLVTAYSLIALQSASR